MRRVDIPQIDNILDYYKKDKALTIKNKVVQIVNKYQDELIVPGSIRRISDYNDELYKVLLSNTLYIGRAYDSRTVESETYKSFLELNPLYQKLQRHKGSNVQISFNFLGTPLAIKDEKLNSWIRNRILMEIEAMNLPAEFKDLRFLAYVKGDKQVLDMLKRRAVKKPLNQGAAKYMMAQSILTYLRDRVTLISDGSIITSVETRFIIELFVAVELFDQDYIDPDTTYPIGSLFTNFKTLLNRWHHNELITSVTYS